MNYVASLGLNDRWLDELHYLYAIELVKRDQRVKALKVLMHLRKQSQALDYKVEIGYLDYY